MPIKNYCQNCGNEIKPSDEFCSKCGYKINIKQTIRDTNQSNGFFDNLTLKTSFPIIILSFIVTALFIFIGSFIWGILLSSKIINIFIYLFLTLGLASFFGGLFIGLTACKDKTYITPNFLTYIGTLIAIILGGSSLMFTFSMGLMTLLGSATSSTNIPALNTSSTEVNTYANSYYGEPSTTNYLSTNTDTGMFSLITGLGFNALLLIILIPVTNYLGITLGYYLKESL